MNFNKLFIFIGSVNFFSRIQATRQQTNNGICDGQTQVCWSHHQGIQKFYCIYHSNQLIIIFVGETTDLNGIHLMGMKLAMELVLQCI